MNSAQNEEDSGQCAVVDVRGTMQLCTKRNGQCSRYNALDSVVGGQYNSAQNDIHTIRDIFLIFFYFSSIVIII